MKTICHPKFSLCLLTALSLFVLPVLALPPGEQADDFYNRGAAAEKRGDIKVARNCYQLALRVDPNHRETLLKLGEQAKKKADEHVARGLAAEGKGDQATANIEYVLALDAVPTHVDAGKRMAELKKKMGSSFRTGREVVIREKLRRIVIPRVYFTNMPLDVAVNSLWWHSIQMDTEEPYQERAGTPIVIRNAPGAVGDSDLASLRVNSLIMRNAPLEQVLQAICEQTKTEYRIGDDGVISISRANPAVISRTFKVPPDFVARLIGPQGDPFADRNSRYLRSRFQAFGLSFADDASVVLNEKDELILKGDAGLLKRAAELIATLGGRPLEQDGQLAANPKPIPPPAPSGPLVWKSKDGKSVEGEFVGLDGEAVVIKREGKEFTIPFTRLDPASVAQAKTLANRVGPTAVEDPFVVAAREGQVPLATPAAPNGSAAPVAAGFPTPKHRWSFGGDLRDSLGGAHGTLVDPGEPTARFVDGKLDLSANRGDPSRSPINDAYVDLPNGLVKGVGGKVTFEAWVQPTKNLVRACIFRFEVATVEGLGAHHESGSGPVPPEYRAIFLIPHDQDGDFLGRLARGNRVQDADSGTGLAGEGERHFAMVVDPGDPGAKPAGSMKLYLDGKLAATTSLFAGFLESFNDNNCWLGRGFAGNPFFSGIYNEFRIYDKALSAEQVLASFRAGPDAVIPAAGSEAPE